MLGTLFYAGGLVDRASSLRHDQAWVARRLADPAARVLPVWRNHNLVDGADAPGAVTLRGSAAAALVEMADHVSLLGLDGDVAYFAADVSSHDAPGLASLVGGGEFVDLRRTGPVMDRRDGNLLAHARGLMYWHRHNGFCGNCGRRTESRNGGAMRRCTGCGREQFPRTDPAVIMLVTRPGADGGACLLARSARFLEGMYSTLAGFVDQGESLEEAVSREVMEEAGVAVTDVRYQASQPWPFPASLMLGFRAQATSFDIRLDDELDDARWFSRADIAGFRGQGLRLPRRDSIARWLVETWLAETPG